MWIVKIGGSWIKNPKLSYLLKLFERFSNQNLIFVCGGGIFADCVREIFKNGDMSEETAHILAVKATEITGLYVGSLNKEILIIDKIKSISEIEYDSHTEWQKRVKEVEALREEFFKIGGVPRKKRNQSWTDFKTAVRNFNKSKNNFYKQLKKAHSENLKKKKELVEIAVQNKYNEDL